MLSNNFVIPDTVIQLITELKMGLNQIRPDWIEGIYLTGSVTLSDFYAQKSDVDFVVLYREFPTQKIIDQLTELHHRIQKLHPKPVLNGVYLTKQNLQARNLATGQVIHFQDGKLNTCLFEMGPIALYELKTTAHTMMGTPINQLPIDVDLEQIKLFMYTNINSYWQSWLTRHSSLISRKGLLNRVVAGVIVSLL